MKKLMATALSLLLALSMLTACGGGAEDTKETKTADKAEDFIRFNGSGR